MATASSTSSPPSKTLPSLPPPAVIVHNPLRARYTPRHESLSNISPYEYSVVVGQNGGSQPQRPEFSTNQLNSPPEYLQLPAPSTPTKLITPEIIATPPPSEGKTAHNSSHRIPRRPLNESNQNVTQHNRVPSGQNPQSEEHDKQVENHQPLQYHHQAVEDAQLKALSNGASKLTVRTAGSDGSSGCSNEHPRADYLVPGARNSHIPSPESRGRPTDSPSLRARDHIRANSRHSRSPDNRLSYVDLLNVPYPQAPPSGAEQVVNAGLRNAVGNNASLLSTRKTLDMYKANVKKTSDPAIQYEFAVFMVSLAQEDTLDAQALDNDTTQSPGDIRNDLLKESKSILQRLCDRSYPFAQYYLADGYASGLFNNGRPDLDRSFPLFLAASKHGHAEAMYRTALCYEWGWGCKVEAAKAVQFYQHAASKNHPGAMLRLGRACLTGDMGLGKRYREGIRWLKRGAESADYQYNQAPYDLACLHETGYGADVFKDETYAAQLFTKAADLGHKDASFRLGEAYEFGQLDCPKDPALSIHFYTGAAEQGHAPAQMALCAWYMVGIEHVLEKDESEACEWARKAAQQGLPKAQYTLGYFTEMGIGCRRDPLEANVWYVRAADQGEERAKHRIAAIHAAATGADPVTAAQQGKAPFNGSIGPAADNEKKKRFGIF